MRDAGPTSRRKLAKEAVTGLAMWAATHPALYWVTVHPAVVLGNKLGEDPIHDRFGEAERRYDEIPSYYYDAGRARAVQAAVGLHQLSRIDDLNGARIRNGRYLDNALAHVPGLTTPEYPEGSEPIYMSFVVHHRESRRTDDRAPCSRRRHHHRLHERLRATTSCSRTTRRPAPTPQSDGRTAPHSGPSEPQKVRCRSPDRVGACGLSATLRDNRQNRAISIVSSWDATDGTSLSPPKTTSVSPSGRSRARVPVYAHFGITHRCNLTCKMCGIWRGTEDEEPR